MRNVGLSRRDLVNIRPAEQAEAPILASLALDAKARWGYTAETLERWRPELDISAADIRDRPTFVAVRGAEIVGFYSLRPAGECSELNNLWVLPEFAHTRR